MERLCRGLLVLFTTVIPVTIAVPGRGTDPNSVPDLAGAGPRLVAGVLLTPAAAVIAARRRRTRRT